MSLKQSIGNALAQTRGALDFYWHPRWAKSWGGPFNGQSFRQQIYQDLKNRIGFTAIFETGTFRGTTTEYLHQTSGLPIYTVEIMPRFFGFSKTRFRANPQIFTFLGDSRSFLQQQASTGTHNAQKVFFYLDAHWGEDQPLKKEIQIIFENFPLAVVMIDDFKVPGDAGYLHDGHNGQGHLLDLDYIQPVVSQLKLACFFPSQRAELESGAKRGCVVLAQASELIAALGGLESLRLHAGS